jgi:hypothetical protein
MVFICNFDLSTLPAALHELHVFDQGVVVGLNDAGRGDRSRGGRRRRRLLVVEREELPRLRLKVVLDHHKFTEILNKNFKLEFNWNIFFFDVLIFNGEDVPVAFLSHRLGCFCLAGLSST